MKNLYFLAAVAAFVLGSCTVEEALDPPAGPDDEASAIGFGTFLDRVPQNGIKPLASVMDIDELKGQGFRVQAYNTVGMFWKSWTGDKATPNFMSAQTVTWSGSIPTPGTWTYSPIRYWPRINIGGWGNVTFFAYSPSTVPFVGVTGGDPQLYFNMLTTYSEQTDLIVATKYNARGDENNGKVKFEFDHILSRIGFKVKLKNAYEGNTIRLTGVRVNYKDTKDTGTYTFNSGTNNDSGDKNNKDFENWKRGTHTITGTPSKYLFSGNATLTNTDTYDIDNYLMLIPQENAENTMSVIVHFTIDYPPGSNPASQDYNIGAYLPKTKWEPGIAYTYTLNIALNAVIVDVEESSANWGNEENEDVNIPPITP
jgi:hypothetical protein